MDRAQAIKEIERLFSHYKTLTSADTRLLKALTDGKLYELYVLSHVVRELYARGFRLTFRGNDLQFKLSPGRIRPSDPHFEITSPDPLQRQLWLFVDIEFETLGAGRGGGPPDRSHRHEIDIVIVDVDYGYPTYLNIAFGVECKAVANFDKSILKEVLGVRRELSLLADHQRSILSAHGGVPQVDVPANPPSEYWLAYTDSVGNLYQQSPAAFGIEFRHLLP